ncbi:3-hydroxybutyryl-CoA dehydrogenase [Streptomyces purpurogeneiscleroticus]|uniref:3-hydroxybutyryl-CoA dehydrogenase n=1 Tax=Streptomyces purpurogeneiscleroticus TaxID=68259 RepID=UPI001CBDE47E|nr:3-hydroxybutyryl-CoA dehydrogenase [Streptomyces purpurogeneiscleroticus]MBZ4016252.1 3-hydroxybutyryl-CoA dehydrogenase [Streptomyces purpurogeneiscleroticus]
MHSITSLGVVGCGLMGSGIAEVATRSGLDVLVVEADRNAAEAGRRRITASLDRGVRRGKLSEEQRDHALDRLTFTHDLGDLADREFVIEAVAENRDLKVDVIRFLDKIVEDPAAILATNTSAIPIVDLAAVTDRPEQVIGMHFFNPVQVQQLIELVPALTTSRETTERARHLTGQLGKRAIQAPDRSGFVVNALLIPYLLGAVRMVESGGALPDDVDRGMELGCAHPMGPLRLLDLIGLDTAQAAAESMYEEFKEPLYAPPALLRRMVAAGHLGRKSGRGFYHYAA